MLDRNRWSFISVLLVCLGIASHALSAEKQVRELGEPMPDLALDQIYKTEIPGYTSDLFAETAQAHLYLEKYFIAEFQEDRTAITKALSKSKLSPAQIGRLCRIHRDWIALPAGPSYVNERIGPYDVQYFIGIPQNYDRTRAWPLVVRLPAAGAIINDPANPPKPDDVVKLYAQWVSDELQKHPDAIVIMPLLNMDEFYGPSQKGMNTVVQAIHHVRSRANIDEKKIYLTGIGMAAHAVWNIGLHYTTFFATINPMAGAASQEWQRVRLFNLRNTMPVVWHDQDDKVIVSGHATALITILKQLKYDVVFEMTKGMGHDPKPEIIEKYYQAMRGRERDLYPRQVNLRSLRPEPTFNRLDWVQLYQPLNSGKSRQLTLQLGTGKILVNENTFSIQAALTSPNKIEAKTDNVETLRFYLNPEMVDLAKPITVIINGKTRYEDMARISLDEMLKDQLFLGRGLRYFTAVIDIDLSPRAIASSQSTTRPTTQLASTRPAAGRKIYFTADEGKTLVELDASTASPFLQDGKQWVQAHVYSYDNGRTTFVAYCSKFSPVAGEDMVRKFGENRWFPVSSPAGSIILKVPSPPGTQLPVREVFPQ